MKGRVVRMIENYCIEKDDEERKGTKKARTCVQ